MHRRTFLKLSSIGTAAFAVGCSAKGEDRLHTMVRANEDMVTGQATLYATACRECPAGCGVLAANREGRVIKLEGNPLHPVNRGALCMRGQAALQGLYHPDRLHRPQLREGNDWREISFGQAAALLREKMTAAAGPGRIAMVTETVGRTQMALFETVLAHYGAGAPLVFEPRAYEALKFAYAQVLGAPMLPVLHMEQADMLLGFGADFLETWLSPVAYARKFKAMHGLQEGRKGFFIEVSPFQSLTGVNADRWIGCRPGGEAAVIMGLLRMVLAADTGGAAWRRDLAALAADYTPDAVARLTGVPEAALTAVGERLLGAERPLVLGTGAGVWGASAAAAEMAALFLNLALDPALSLIDRGDRYRVEVADRRDTVLNAFEAMADNDTALVLLNNVNPVFALPGGDRLGDLLAHGDRFTVVFGNTMDETAARADLVVPVQNALETWDVYEATSRTMTTLQPTMGRISAAPGLGDLWLNLLPADRRPATEYRHLTARTVQAAAAADTEAARLAVLQQGGRFDIEPPPADAPRVDREAVRLLARYLSRLPAPTEGPVLLAAPSLRFLDGRTADHPWMPEIPDPVYQVAWQTVAMVHPRTLSDLGAREGDRITIATEGGKVQMHAYNHPGVHPGGVVVPTGQGHTHMGRYARGRGINPATLLAGGHDPLSGAPDGAAPIVRLAAAGPGKALASVSGSRFQHGRKIAVSVPLDRADIPPPKSKYLDMDSFPLTLPLPEGYDTKRDFYPPHEHHTYRWAMVVDLDRCVGCSACVAACYAENSVGVVGEEQVIAGREMAWIRIERYQDEQDPTRLIFLPMLCQHCDNAPCESVCPVYAPHHSVEGLNNQIYNRCIGTRYCGQNCPYKVRRFNWFSWPFPEPLNLQLNPDVTVRSAGVMEKCSFCVQRIKKARTLAKNEKREIRDGEVVPACVQTCPTQALWFGNLMDPESAVRKMVDSPRAYQVMGYLNTKPAVIYLKKVVQTL